MTIDEVTSLMECSQTQEEWDANCAKVKGVYEGYPSFWFTEIVQSGLARRVAARWGGTDQIQIQTITLQ